MAELANCTRCGDIFAKHIRDVCQACFKKEEEEFDAVYHFLKEQENREATLREIVEQTGVAEDVITKFIQTGRLRTSQFPNLAYPCEQCGTDIVAGKLCVRCSHNLLRELENHEKNESKRKERRQHSGVYFSWNKGRK